MSDYKAMFNASYWRTLATSVDGVPFIDAFYLKFLASSEEAALRFVDTDFAKQSNMLILGLVHLSSYDGTPDPTTEHLAARHREMNIDPRLFEVWLGALVETVATYDPKYAEDVGDAWRRMLGPGVKFMAGVCRQPPE